MPDTLKTTQRTRTYAVTVDAGSVSANASLDVTFAAAGLQTDEFIHVVAPALEAGLSISNAHVSAEDTVKVRLVNGTGSPVNPVSQTFHVARL